MSHLAKRLKLAVILVVGVRLGCINHAILSHNAIINSGVECAGWIANCVEPGFACLQQNIDSLRSELSLPCLAVIPHIASPREAYLNHSLEKELFMAGREEFLRSLSL